MKNLFALTILCLSSVAFSSDKLLQECGPIAEKEATKRVKKNYYDKDGIWAYECVLAPNKAVVICDLGANKGDGGATDTLRVVLNKTCTKVFKVTLISEE